jgi:GNAT superfamily N-acetyltransferase
VNELQAAFESVKPRAPALRFDDFEEFVRGAEVHPAVVDGEVVGALIVKGPEIHACVLPKAKGRWGSKRLLSVLHRVIRTHGYATTSATTADGVAFVRRLGFVQDGNRWVKYGH